jgi:hypothetical protein
VLRINFNDTSRDQSRTAPPITDTASYFWIGKFDEVLAAKLSKHTKEGRFMRSITLDPNKTGRDSDRLLTNLGRLIAGQEEAVQQIVNTYQIT